ncbi:MAG: PaaI family thioesterase [Solobacterium sp.]|nr:PaaI family thioesterase [Solobacterium sp.]
MDYQRLIKARNESGSFRNLVGVVATDIGEGYAVCELEVTDKVRNQIHSVAGGCLYTLADTAAGSVCAGYGIKATTTNSDFHFLNPGLNCTKLYAYAKEIKHGKRLAVVAVDVKDQDDNLLSYGVFSFMFLNEPIDYL